MKPAATQAEWALSPEAVLLGMRETALEGAERDAVIDAFCDLPVRWREVCTLRWVEGWPRHRVADHCNLTVAAVRAIEASARARIIGEAA